MLIFLIVVVAVLALWAIKIYNGLQRKMQSIRKSHSNIQSMIQRRQNQMGQIIDIAREVATNEKDILETISGKTPLQGLAALSQAFPELKQSESYKSLQEQINLLETELDERRNNFNSVVEEFNQFRNSFPQMLIAGKLGFEEVKYFDINDYDFTKNTKIFEKDDSAVLNSIINTTSRKIADGAKGAKNAISDKITGAKQIEEKQE